MGFKRLVGLHDNPCVFFVALICSTLHLAASNLLFQWKVGNWDWLWMANCGGRLLGWTEKNGSYAMRHCDKKYVGCLVLKDFDWGGIVDNSLELWTILPNFGCGCDWPRIII